MISFESVFRTCVLLWESLISLISISARNLENNEKKAYFLIEWCRPCRLGNEKESSGARTTEHSFISFFWLVLSIGASPAVHRCTAWGHF